MEVFWQYIVGMLTNQGAMPLARIVMMLNLVVPGGFSYGQEELRAYLERRIGEGKVELVGGSYRVVKEKA
jgi:anaphase-promoting complex subunit 2